VDPDDLVDPEDAEDLEDPEVDPAARLRGCAAEAGRPEPLDGV